MYYTRGYPVLLLEGQHPAEFSSIKLQHTFLEISSESEDLYSIRIRAKLCRTVALQEEVWTPLYCIYSISFAPQWFTLLYSSFL